MSTIVSTTPYWILAIYMALMCERSRPSSALPTPIPSWPPGTAGPRDPWKLTAMAAARLLSARVVFMTQWPWTLYSISMDEPVVVKADTDSKRPSIMLMPRKVAASHPKGHQGKALFVAHLASGT